MDEAFQAGRVSDEIFPGWKVPTYYEAQQKADDVIRSQFERARPEYGGKTRPAISLKCPRFLLDWHVASLFMSVFNRGSSCAR